MPYRGSHAKGERTYQVTLCQQAHSSLQSGGVQISLQVHAPGHVGPCAARIPLPLPQVMLLQTQQKVEDHRAQFTGTKLLRSPASAPTYTAGDSAAHSAETRLSTPKPVFESTPSFQHALCHLLEGQLDRCVHSCGRAIQLAADGGQQRREPRGGRAQHIERYLVCQRSNGWMRTNIQAAGMAASMASAVRTREQTAPVFSELPPTCAGLTACQCAGQEESAAER